MPIFDQGYQHWNGELSGHAWRWLAIARNGVRVGLKNRFVRMLLLLSWLLAAVLTLVLCMWGLAERQAAALINQPSNMTSLLQLVALMFGRQVLVDPRHFRTEVWTVCYNFFLTTELWLSMVLILLIGPNLISQDIRFNAMPLYFSRPLRRIDYFVGKLGIIAAFLGMVVIIPCVLAYVLGMLFSLEFSVLHDTYRLLIGSLVYGTIITFSAGLLVLALSSLSRNSRYIAIAWLAIWFVSGILGTILQGVEREQRTRHLQRTSAAFRFEQPANPATMSVEERRAWQTRQMRNLQQMQQRRDQELLAIEQSTTRTDWRPTVSYAGNLRRIGEALLHTNAAWEKLSELQPVEMRARFLLTFMGPQYPWYWSGGVLAGLFVLSAGILNFRVKSLDRLK